MEEEIFDINSCKFLLKCLFKKKSVVMYINVINSLFISHGARYVKSRLVVTELVSRIVVVSSFRACRAELIHKSDKKI